MVLIFACPKRLLMVVQSTPLNINRLACVCLKACGLICGKSFIFCYSCPSFYFLFQSFYYTAFQIWCNNRLNCQDAWLSHSLVLKQSCYQPKNCPASGVFYCILFLYTLSRSQSSLGIVMVLFDCSVLGVSS